MSTPPSGRENRNPRELGSRLQQREQQLQDATHDALTRLAAVAQADEHAVMPRVGAPLLAAVTALADAAGIAIVSPRNFDPGWDHEQALRAIERNSHIRTRKVLLEAKWWNKDCGPILAFRANARTPVALLYRARKYSLLDPGTGGESVVDVEVAASLEPFGFVLYRPFPEKIHHPLDIVLFSMRGMQREILVLLLTAMAGALLAMFTPIATMALIDTAIPDANRSLLLQLGLGLLAAAAGKSLFDLTEVFVSTRVTTATNAVTQGAVWDRLLKLRPSFLRKYSTGDLSSRAMAISTIFRRLSATSLRAIFGSFVSLLNLALMFYYSPLLAVIGLVAGLLIAAATQASGVAMLKRLRPLQLLEGKIFGLTVQLINGISKLRVSGTERFAFVYWGKRYTEQQRLNYSAQRIQDWVSSLNQTIPTLATAIVFFVAGTAMAGPGSAGLSPGSFLAFSAAFGVFIGSLAFLSNTGVDMLNDLSLWRRSEPILSAEPEMDPSKSLPGKLQGKIEISHVTFRYQQSGRLILEDVSVVAEPGQFVAVVGPSGSGKSTLLRLLLAFETPISGHIQFDGQDLNGLDPLAVRRQLGVVLQTSSLLGGSIFQNIAAGASITLDQAWEAVRQAGLESDIKALPMGMHTYLSEGATNVSTGQRQRLLIARALVFKPRVLLFDEATSALDNRAQATVSQSLDRLNVTRLVIAHRLSTIRNADHIYVMESGRIVEHGTFAELAVGGGLFSRMMARQML
jgi:NHLM bacteriocin system ABC transporter ATP-binding protein